MATEHDVRADRFVHTIAAILKSYCVLRSHRLNTKPFAGSCHAGSIKRLIASR